MADIAILVVEEYERRMKKSRKEEQQFTGRDALEFNWVPPVVDMVKNIKVTTYQHNMRQAVNCVLEPKTQIGIAASNGFFSA